MSNDNVNDNVRAILDEIRAFKREAKEFASSDYRTGYLSALSALEGFIAGLPAVGVLKWISVEDPPKKGGRYLILFEDGHCCDAEYDECIDGECPFGEWEAIYDSHSLGYVDSEWRAYQEVTHWMPLPELPGEDV